MVEVMARAMIQVTVKRVVKVTGKQHWTRRTVGIHRPLRVYARG